MADGLDFAKFSSELLDVAGIVGLPLLVVLLAYNSRANRFSQRPAQDPASPARAQARGGSSPLSSASCASSTGSSAGGKTDVSRSDASGYKAARQPAASTLSAAQAGNRRPVEWQKVIASSLRVGLCLSEEEEISKITQYLERKGVRVPMRGRPSERRVDWRRLFFIIKGLDMLTPMDGSDAEGTEFEPSA
jgi:hypothetical protein